MKKTEEALTNLNNAVQSLLGTFTDLVDAATNQEKDAAAAAALSKPFLVNMHGITTETSADALLALCQKIQQRWLLAHNDEMKLQEDEGASVTRTMDALLEAKN